MKIKKYGVLKTFVTESEGNMIFEGDVIMGYETNSPNEPYHMEYNKNYLKLYREVSGEFLGKIVYDILYSKEVEEYKDYN